jgi:hypothetical protein
MAGPVTPDELREAVLRAVRARGPRKSICPSEVARAVAPEDWRPLMSRVRAAAAELSRDGRVVILRKGKPIPAEEMHGVIRLAAPDGEAAP